MAIQNTLSAILRRRAEYRQTRNAIRSMPLEVALDLDIAREDADRIAARAVYGR